MRYHCASPGPTHARNKGGVKGKKEAGRETAINGGVEGWTGTVTCCWIMWPCLSPVIYTLVDGWAKINHKTHGRNVCFSALFVLYACAVTDAVPECCV